jgi:hypothetical protein
MASDRRLSYRSRTFHALAHDFRFVAESDAVGRYFEEVLSGLPRAHGPAHEYSIRAVDAGGEQDCTEIVLEAGGADPVVVATNVSIGALAGSFVHHLNREAITAEYGVMCHAGAVARHGVGVILPADPESGKTTLTAGLVRAGFSYLTDEAALVDPTTNTIEPYPKPLSIDSGSHQLFPELEPAPAPGDDSAPSDQWQVPPDAIRPGAVGDRSRVRLVVFPKYEEGATTELVPVSRASGLVELATNTFEFRDHARRSLDALAAVIVDADCYRLTVGGLDDACRVVGDLVESTLERQRA